MKNQERKQVNRERQQVKDQQSHISVFAVQQTHFLSNLQVAVRSTNSDMTTAFHARPYGRFIEIQGNLVRKKLHRTNQGSDFCGGSFSNRYNLRAPNQI